MPHYLGESYNDDRLFILDYGRVRRGADTVWGVITRRNIPGRFPPFRSDVFDSEEAAIAFIQSTEPSTPRISLGGRSPDPVPTYEEYCSWLAREGIPSSLEVHAITGGPLFRTDIVEVQEAGGPAARRQVPPKLVITGVKVLLWLATLGIVAVLLLMLVQQAAPGTRVRIPGLIVGLIWFAVAWPLYHLADWVVRRIWPGVDAPQEPMYPTNSAPCCPGCGAIALLDARFCGDCGASLAGLRDGAESEGRRGRDSR